MTELSARVADRLAGVDGWLNADEADALAVAARELSVPEATVVEIGSWKGRSAIALASGLEAGGQAGTVWAIDPHTGNVEHHQRYGDVDTFADFLANLEVSGVADRVEPLRMFSAEARSRFADGSVHLLFVDGSHEYEDVCQDIREWRSALVPGAIVAFNDSSWPGVFQALKEHVLTPGAGFTPDRLVRSTLFLRFTPGMDVDPSALRRLRRVMTLRVLAGHVQHRLPRWLKRLGNCVSSRAAIGDR